MKTVIFITTTALSLLFLVTSVKADDSSVPRVYGKINEKTQVVKYTHKDGPTRSITIRTNQQVRTTANNSVCDRKMPPTCSFIFGKNKNQKLNKKQIRFIKSGRSFNVVVGARPNIFKVVTYHFKCSVKSSNGRFSCTLKGAFV